MNRLRIVLIAAALTSFGLQPLLLAQSDTTPPTLTGLVLASANVDVSSGAQNLTITATATDDLSGVNYVEVYFRSPSGQNVYGFLYRTGGTNLNGTYSGMAAFPEYSENGTWSVTVYLRDAAGNLTSLQSNTLMTLGFPYQLTVTDTNPDTTPPSLTGIGFSPATVDTSGGPQTITVSLGVTDAQSGAVFNNSPTVTFAVTLEPINAGATGPALYLSTHDFSLVSGTTQNGVWQATKQIPQYAAAGPWRVVRLYMGDAAGNQISLSASQISAMGITSTFNVLSDPSDSTVPTLTGLSFAPAVIDTSGSSQDVVINVLARDDLSGVDFTPLTADITYTLFGFNSPSGSQHVYESGSFLNPASLIAGTPLNGTFQLTATWPQFSEQGTWTLQFLQLKDKAGNFRTYQTADLQTLGINTTIIVTKPSLVPDGTIGISGGTVDDTAFGSRASVIFPPGLVSGPVSVSIDVFPDPLSVPTPAGFTLPGTYFVNLSFAPAFPTPIPAPGITVTAPLITPMTPGAHLSLYHVDSVLGMQPAYNAAHNPVIGTVNSDGVSATFNNVVTLSPVVAYISTGSILGDVDGNGNVNCVDVSLVKSSFGKTKGQVGFNSAADLNSDGVVNILDLFVVDRQLPAGMSCR